MVGATSTTKKLSQFDLARYGSYHDVSLAEVDFIEAESQLSDDRKKYLRTAAKEKAGQAAGVGAMSSAAKGVYIMMVKQKVRPAVLAGRCQLLGCVGDGRIASSSKQRRWAGGQARRVGPPVQCWVGGQISAGKERDGV